MEFYYPPIFTCECVLCSACNVVAHRLRHLKHACLPYTIYWKFICRLIFIVKGGQYIERI